MKKLIALIPCIVSSYQAHAADIDFAQMAKQLNIMEKIIQSSVNTTGHRNEDRISGIESTYLSGQGILFSIRSTGGRGQWGSYNFNLPAAPVPPVPPVLISDATIEQIERASGINPEINVEETIAHAMETAAQSYEQALESLSEHRDSYRDLRDEQRDIAYELRDIEREVRDIEYQMKRATKEEQKSIKASLVALEKKKEKLQSGQKALIKRASDYKKQQEIQYAQLEEQRKSYYDKLSVSMAETLCLYGNALKQLPKGERVTLILNAGGDKVDRRFKDKIHVFNKRDINGCATDEITSAQLLEKSHTYQF